MKTTSKHPSTPTVMISQLFSDLNSINIQSYTIAYKFFENFLKKVLTFGLTYDIMISDDRSDLYERRQTHEILYKLQNP